MRLVVFDMDGTLNKTEVYAVEAYRKTLRDLGAGEFSGEEILGRIGAPFEEDFTYFFGEKAEEMKEPFMKTLGYYWDTLLEEKACAFEGVKEMLQNLKAKRVCACHLFQCGRKGYFNAGRTDRHSGLYGLHSASGERRNKEGFSQKTSEQDKAGGSLYGRRSIL